MEDFEMIQLQNWIS